MTDTGLVKAVEARITKRIQQNQRIAMFRPFRGWLDRRRLRGWTEALRAIPANRGRLIHIACGFDGSRGAEHDVTLAECIAILSARIHHPTATLVIHAPVRPTGPCWAFLQERVTLVMFPHIRVFRGARWPLGASEATMVRLLALNISGGISPASDMLLLRNCDDLNDGRFVVGARLMTTAGTGGLDLNLLAAPRDHRVTRTLVAAAAGFVPGEDMTTTLLSALYAAYAVTPQAVRVLSPTESALPARHAAEVALFGNPRLGSAPMPHDAARALPLRSEVTAAHLNAFGPADLASSQGLFASLARATVARMTGTEAANWAEMIRVLRK